MAENNSKLGVEFLLAEFNAIQQRAIHIEHSKSSSVNFYLVIVAATIAGVPGILSLVPTEAARLVLVAMFAFIFAVGLLTLDHSVNQAVNIIRLYRRAGKIRRFFLTQASDIKIYLPFEASDSLPRINLPSSLAYRGAEVTVFAINIASVAVISAVIFSFASWFGAIIAALAGAGITWQLQRIFFRKKLQRFEEKAKRSVIFPETLE